MLIKLMDFPLKDNVLVAEKQQGRRKIDDHADLAHTVMIGKCEHPKTSCLSYGQPK